MPKMSPRCVAWVTLILLVLRAEALNLPPVFTSDMNQHAIKENTPVGTKIYTLQGMDPEGTEVRFGVEGTRKFRADPVTGDVIVQEKIDREDGNNEIRLTVVIQDEVAEGSGARPNIVRVPVSVIVLDENDNEPVFRGTPYTTSVLEDTPAGTIIFRALEVTDADLVGDVLEVECVDKETGVCDVFEIVPRRRETDLDMFRGNVVLKKSLDYRDKQIYKVPISVFDGKHRVFSEITFEVLDVQNSPPTFSGAMTGVVNEDDPIGTSVLKVRAIDGDTGNPRRIVYEMIENPFEYFLIDPNSGEIRVDKILDREATNGVLTLKVRASEIINGIVASEDPTSSTVADVTITIRDVNDEPPTFNKREYFVSIPENVPFGTPFANLDMEVKDSDTGPNSIFKIDLEDSTGKFAIEPKTANGHTAVSLKVNTKQLDYENPNERKFLLLVIATETNTQKRLSSTATVTVQVRDLNDNSPVFEKEAFTAIVSENDPEGTHIVTVNARDRDSGDYGSNGIRYSLSGSGAELFDVDPISGRIIVAACETDCIDYEKTKAYFLSYSAVDNNGEGKKTVVNLRISVADANDNPPILEKKEYTANINEGEKDFSPKLIVRAKDEDDSSILEFKIIEGNVNELFVINKETGEISVANENGLRLDNIPTDKIRLVIEVSDGVHSDTTVVNISVKDVNDRYPTFEKESYSSNIPENAPLNSLVESVRATDADFGRNAEITYRIAKGAYDDFVIDPKTGDIRVSGSLDYDRKSNYVLEVLAVDDGFPSQLSGTALVQIEVMNKNDKIPYFSPTTQRAQITEDTNVGTIVLKLNATDADAGNSSLEFSIVEPITAVDGDGARVVETDVYKSFFGVNPKTGEISIREKLDRNVASIVSMGVKITDTSATPPQEGLGNVVINIIDVNDFEPRFEKPWSPEQPYITINVKEEEPNGTTVFTFLAVDPDSNIDYFLIRPKNPYFIVERDSGKLKVRSRIDFEALETKRITFDLHVYDAGIPQKSASAFVIANIINLNDESPSFAVSKYNASIPENSKPNYPILNVEATDLDEGEFGKVTYSLSGMYKDAFSIDPEAGLISVADSSILDRETLQYVTLQVIAKDSAPVESRRSSSVPVNITIIDVNDHAPIFSSPSYQATIVDNIQHFPHPSPIIQVSATDKDEGINGELFYQIISGNEEGRFFIDNRTGIIFPNATFSGLNGREFELVVQVLDEGGSRQVWDSPEITMVKIGIDNVNTHKPEWFPDPPPDETVEITEESEETDYVILKVNARDRDFGDNQRISYFLKVNNINVRETNDFSMDENTGELRAKVIFDREEKSKYELVLVAKDHGTPVSFETLRFVTVVIKDINDNEPLFDYKSPVKFTVPENEDPGYLVGKITAYDPDEGPNGHVYYYIVEGNDGRELTIDKTYGNIYTKMKLDRELVEEYRIRVKVSNNPDIVCEGKTCDLEFQRSDDENGLDDKTIVEVHVFVEDQNDNDPQFESPVFNVGIPHNAKVGDLILDVPAFDPDIEKGALSYAIRSSDLFPHGETQSAGSLVPSPFKINENGRLSLASLMAEFNQDKFVLDIEAKEASSLHRAKAQVNVWVYEPQQLIKLVVNEPPLKVNERKNEIINELTNVTENTVVVSEIRYHVSENQGLRRDMTDMYLHVVDEKQNEIMPPEKIIKTVDANYDHLNLYYEKAGIVSILPATENVSSSDVPFDKNLAALIALILLIFLGVIVFSILCCCMETWITGTKKNKPVRLQESPQLGYTHKTNNTASILEGTETVGGNGNGTENPLWIDQKYKAYEEQELTMTVFTDQENSVISGPGGNHPHNLNGHHDMNPHHHSRQGSVLLETQSNAYATINKFPNPASMTARRTTLFNGSLDIDSERDYATLEKNISRSPPGPVVPGIHSSAGTYQGSLPRRFSNEFTGPACPVLPPGSKQPIKSNIIINKQGEPELVAELM